MKIPYIVDGEYKRLENQNFEDFGYAFRSSACDKMNQKWTVNLV